MSTCKICKTVMFSGSDVPENLVPYQDCGGDCLKCMAEEGDMFAIEKMYVYYKTRFGLPEIRKRS